MYKYVIIGGKKLSGNTYVSGSKNASLPILAATILNEGKTILSNIPEIDDVKIMIQILNSLGCVIDKNEDKLIIDSSNINQDTIPTDLMKKLRASVIIVGALLARKKKAVFSYPGGCRIGSRPIDLHINNFKKLGIKVNQRDDLIECNSKNIISNHIVLDFPSVGATENLILASVLGKEEIEIENAALEPEIFDLVSFLNKMGAKIYGAGTSNLKIVGVKKLNEVEYRVIPDRIEAGTLLVATAISRGEAFIDGIVVEHITPIINSLTKIGCKIIINDRTIYIDAKNALKSIDIETSPYPRISNRFTANIYSITYNL
jgi:UDP-N-acetylglucosamine 1-carboxyvinyltransferase